MKLSKYVNFSTILIQILYINIKLMPDCLQFHLKLGLIMSFTMLENLFVTLINYLIESLSFVKTQNMIFNRFKCEKKSYKQL
jgi:hypothetical protein